MSAAEGGGARPGRRYAIVTGSGFDTLAGDTPMRGLVTRYGLPSAPVREVRFGEHAVLVLARHGEPHRLAPHRINYRANAAALAMLGVNCIVALNTVGVVRRGALPGELAVPAQIIDYTWGRDHSIRDGTSATLRHVDFTEPFAAGLRSALLAAARRSDVDCHDGGVYGVTQGPRLETRAEVDRYERDGVDYLGMTAMPEAALARELDMDYACLSLLVNAAAGRGDKGIHDDIAASTLTARAQAMRVLKAFFSVADPLATVPA